MDSKNILIKKETKSRLWTSVILLATFSFMIFNNSAFGVQNPMRTMKYSSRSTMNADLWQSDLRAKLFNILKMSDLLAKRDSIALNPKEILSEDKGEYLLKEIEFNSTKERRIKVIFTVPKRTNGPWPAVVCIHGHGGTARIVYDKTSIYKGFADELAAKNYVTIAAMVSQHVIYEDGRTLMGERLWDLMRCVDYLKSLKEVDINRIGCAGLSLGGEMAMWLGAMDVRVQATLSSGFLTKMDQMEKNHCMCWKFPGLRELVDYADIYSLIAPRPLECQNGLKEPANDFTVALAGEALKEIKVIYTDYKRPENVSLIAHQGAHEIDLPTLLTFFDKELGAPSIRKMKYTSRSAKEAAIWQNDVRSKLFELLRLDDLMASRKSIALNPKEILSENKGEYLQKEIEFNSTPARRIKVIFTIPVKTKGQLPAVVCIHGHGGTPGIVYDKTSIYKGFASELATKNYITIAAVVSQHVIYENGRTLMGERLWDLMRCVDYLESLPQVDKSRIGCGGLSLGGEMTMWLGAMDVRIKAAVSSGFLTTMDQMEHNHCMCWKFQGLRELVDYADIYSLIAPNALQCQNGLKENEKSFYVPLARTALKEIEVIYTDYKQPEKVTLVAHPGGHEIDLPTLLSLFDKQLGSKK